MGKRLGWCTKIASQVTAPQLSALPPRPTYMGRLFYGCSYMFHLSGNHRRDSHFRALDRVSGGMRGRFSEFELA